MPEALLSSLQEYVPEPDEFALALFEAARLCGDFERTFKTDPRGNESEYPSPAPTRLEDVLYELRDEFQRQIKRDRLNADQVGRVVAVLRYLVRDLRIDLKTVRNPIGDLLISLSEVIGAARYREPLQKYADEVERLRTFWETRTVIREIAALERYAQGPRQKAAEVAWDLPSAVEAMHQTMLNHNVDELEEAELGALVGKVAILIDYGISEKPCRLHPSLVEAALIYLGELLDREKTFLLPLVRRITRVLKNKKWSAEIQQRLAALERHADFLEADDETRMVMTLEPLKNDAEVVCFERQKPHPMAVVFSDNTEAISIHDVPAVLFHIEHLIARGNQAALPMLSEVLHGLLSRNFPQALAISIQRVIFELRFAQMKRGIQAKLRELRQTREALDILVAEGIDPYEWLKSTTHGPN